ncbi:hypothetical protein B0H11DRAFT_1975986 [Mycena galericulata]|nr:hypothetical protein B0H11DRAFT_1975986 [Mycena galericulata]
MASHIPDEIIHEILYPALRVPDEAFSATSALSPFSSPTESSSALLLVSKSWLRVATPLVYNVVIIRSKAQAQALAVALRSNPDLGRFIKKLRVEGGYAISMLKILQTAKNLTDLYLSLDIEKSDNACGMCRGLPLIHPVRVILKWYTIYYNITEAATKLVDALAESIPKWKNLIIFEVLHHDYAPVYTDKIWNTLKASPNLHTLVISDPHRMLFRHGRVSQYILTVAANPSLKRIQLRVQSRQPLSPEVFETVQKNARLKALIDLQPFNIPSFIYPPQLAADPGLEDVIWGRVLRFAITGLKSNSEARYYDSTSYFDSGDSELDHTSSVSLLPLLACKRFLRLGIQYLYENPVLISTSAARQFVGRLVEQPSLGLHVRRLSILNYYFDNLYADEYLQDILPRTPSLSVLTCEGFPLSWKMFENLGALTGKTLRTVHRTSITQAIGNADPAVFARFPQMQSFIWDSKTVFSAGLKSTPGNIFDKLVDLSIENFDPSFLAVLSNMELPSLRSVAFGESATGGNHFFQKHGKKFHKLTVSIPQLESDLGVFSNCPSIKALRISINEKSAPRPSSFAFLEPHRSLERIVFKASLHPPSRSYELDLENLLLSLDRTTFPALREIQHPHCTWPVSERATSQDYWVKWAETLRERDIHLVDQRGVRWRRRLQYVPRKITNKS